MALSTRLQKQPERRVRYDGPTDRGGSRGTLIALNNDDPPLTTTAGAPKRPIATRAKARKTAARTKAGAVVKPEAPPIKVIKKAAPRKKRLPPPQRECSLCASMELVSESFVLDQHEDACEHFRGICNMCIDHMLREKVSRRQLAEPGLSCPFPECQNILDHDTLKMVFTDKTHFALYDAALTQHHLASDPSFITCLSYKCGKYFSIEDCSGNAPENSAQKIACPYCEYTLCLTCNRPWHSGAVCSEAAKKEDEKSMNRIKTMGAKGCPNCGINIQKQGGCDHMTCHNCRHNFCWLCLAHMTANASHGEGCPHGHRNVDMDPGNWAPHNATPAQINALIAQAHQPRGLEGMRQLLARHIPGGWPQVINDDDDDNSDNNDDVQFLRINPRPTQHDP